MGANVVHSFHAPLLVSNDQAPAASKFKDSQRVKFCAGVTGGLHSARILNRRYSPFFGGWLYDIEITGGKSPVYPKGSMHFGISESVLRPRIF